MTKEELIEKLNSLNDLRDNEAAHCKADDLLLEYIDDKEIAEAFDNVNKWYA